MNEFFDELFSQIKNEYKEKYQEEMDLMSFWTECMGYIDGLVEDEMEE